MRFCVNTLRFFISYHVILEHISLQLADHVGILPLRLSNGILETQQREAEKIIRHSVCTNVYSSETLSARASQFFDNKSSHAFFSLQLETIS